MDWHLLPPIIEAIQVVFARMGTNNRRPGSACQKASTALLVLSSNMTSRSQRKCCEGAQLTPSKPKEIRNILFFGCRSSCRDTSRPLQAKASSYDCSRRRAETLGIRAPFEAATAAKTLAYSADTRTKCQGPKQTQRILWIHAGAGHRGMPRSLRGCDSLGNRLSLPLCRGFPERGVHLQAVPLRAGLAGCAPEEMLPVLWLLPSATRREASIHHRLLSACRRQATEKQQSCRWAPRARGSLSLLAPQPAARR